MQPTSAPPLPRQSPRSVWITPEILGDTLAKIAFEKAGILKRDLTCAVAAQAPEAEAVLVARAREVGATLWFEGRDFALEGSAYRGPNGTLLDIHVGLLGAHQLHNAAVALALLDIAGRSLAVPAGARRTGIAKATWAGRLQLIREPLEPKGAKPGVNLVLDGAHNPPAAEALAAAVKSCLAGPRHHHRLRRPERQGIFAHAGHAVASGEESAARRAQSPRARNPRTYLAEALKLIADVKVAPAGKKALSQAFEVTPREGLVLVCGSLYLVAEALAVAAR